MVRTCTCEIKWLRNIVDTGKGMGWVGVWKSSPNQLKSSVYAHSYAQQPHLGMVIGQ
jgi:hypothetical protein